MPSFPNYRLGPMDNPGQPCSPVVNTTAPPTPLPAFSVFPNPVRTALKIIPNRQFSGPGRFRLFDGTGRLQRDSAFEPTDAVTALDMQALPAGMYFFEIWCEGKRQRVGKLLKLD